MTAIVFVAGGVVVEVDGDAVVIDYDNLATGGCPACGKPLPCDCWAKDLDWGRVTDDEITDLLERFPIVEHTKVMTFEEWASLSAESRHKLNMYSIRAERMEAALKEVGRLVAGSPLLSLVANIVQRGSKGEMYGQVD